jgi:hypothetical protein
MRSTPAGSGRRSHDPPASRRSARRPVAAPRRHARFRARCVRRPSAPPHHRCPANRPYPRYAAECPRPGWFRARRREWCPATSVTIARSSPANRFSSEDLPTLGKPASTTCRPDRNRRRRAHAPSKPDRSRRFRSRRCAASVSRSTSISSSGKSSVASTSMRNSTRRATSALTSRENSPDSERNGRARRRRGSRFDQVGDRFGLNQVQLVIEKCALRELAGLRHPRTQLQTTSQQHLQHHRPTVPLQLEYILAGKGMRRRKIQQDALVDGAPRRPREKYTASHGAARAGGRKSPRQRAAARGRKPEPRQFRHGREPWRWQR